MNDGVRGERGSFRPKELRIEDDYEVFGKNDVVGIPDLEETAFQLELRKNDDKARVDGRHLRTHPEKMREQLEAEERQNRARTEGETREAQERTERAHQVVERYRQEDREEQRRDVLGDARKYAAQKKAEEKREQDHQKTKAQETLKAINTQLSDLLTLQRTSKESLWSFLPARRREVAKLEEAIRELRTRARIQRLQIADLVGEYHADSRKPRTWEIPNSLPEFTEEEIEALSKDSLESNRGKVRTLYKEKVSLQAEREGWAILVRPFRRHAIDARLEEVTREIEDLQEEIRKSARAA